MKNLSLEGSKSEPPQPDPTNSTKSTNLKYYSHQTVSLTLVEAALNARLDGETMKGVKEVLKKNAPSKTRIAFVYQRDSDLAANENVNNNSGTISFLKVIIFYSLL